MPSKVFTVTILAFTASHSLAADIVFNYKHLNQLKALTTKEISSEVSEILSVQTSRISFVTWSGQPLRLHCSHYSNGALWESIFYSGRRETSQEILTAYVRILDSMTLITFNECSRAGKDSSSSLLFALSLGVARCRGYLDRLHNSSNEIKNIERLVVFQGQSIRTSLTSSWPKDAADYGRFNKKKRDSSLKIRNELKKTQSSAQSSTPDI